MRSFALIGLSAAALQGVAATSWRSQPEYSCPKNIKNDCTTDEHQGFDWTDLDVGDFTDYKNYKFQGWKCTNNIGKRNLEGRHFNNKCIESELDQDKFSNEITSHKEFSIGEIDVSVDIDIDVEFHYGMPDGSNCKKVARCSKDGSTVRNDQCGGAKTVKVKIPKRSEQKKCTLGMHKVKFECGKSTTSIPIPTSTIPTSTYTSVPATDVLTSSKVRSSKVKSTVSTTSGVPCTLCSAPPSEETSYSSAPPSEETSYSSAPPAKTTYHSGIPSAPFGNSTSYTAPSAPCTKCSMVPPIGDNSSAPPSEKTSTSSAPCSTCSAIPPIEESSSASAPPVKSTSRPALPPVETTPIPPEGAIPITTIAPAPSTGTALIPGKQSSSYIWSNSSLPVPSSAPPMPPTNCPETLPRCLKTWLFVTSCRDTADPSCFCRSSKFVNQISDCLQSWGKSDSDVEKSVEYFLGLCQPYIHENPAIVTCIPPSVTLPPAPPNVPVQVITRTIVTVVPCEPTVISTGKGGSPAVGTVVSYTTSTFTSLVTIPQVTLVVTAPEAHLEYPKVPATNFAPHATTPGLADDPARSTATGNVPGNNLGAITTRRLPLSANASSSTGVPEQYTGGAAGFGVAVMAGVLGAVGVVVFQL